MAWTAPRTWSPGETVTASMMNVHIRDNINVLASTAVIVGFGDVGGGVLTTGVKFYVQIPFKCRITGWTLLADASGSLVIDVWKDTYANFPPVVADTITGSEKPTLSAVQKNQDLSLTTWTTAVAAGDILGFNIDSAATVKQATLTLALEKE